jgi:hypothetical protein
MSIFTRNNILRNPAPLRNVISAPEFVEHFGEPKPHPKGSRRSIFGHEDELKVAPKGVEKNHKCGLPLPERFLVDKTNAVISISSSAARSPLYTGKFVGNSPDD